MLHRADLLLEEREALGERLQEPLLLVPHAVYDVGAPFDELGIGASHLVHDALAHAMEEGLLESEQDAMARGSTQDASQHVATTLIRGEDAISNQEGDGARVIRHDT